jgi:hypothetical protein
MYMNSSQAITNKAQQMLRRAWVNLGLPFDGLMVHEKKEGIIDVESLLLATILFMGHDRIATDVPAWIARFQDLINHQKLKSMIQASPEKYRMAILESVKQISFQATPAPFRKIFGLPGHPPIHVIETVESRKGKLNSVDHVAQSSIMINNRLLYGTGFRADLITIAQIRNHHLNGKRLSHLLCAADSTISRILIDLKACRFINQEYEIVKNVDTFPGMFISFHTLRNLYEILDAEEFRSPELKKAAYESLDFRYDQFGRQLLRGEM